MERRRRSSYLKVAEKLINMAEAVVAIEKKFWEDVHLDADGKCLGRKEKGGVR